MKRLLTFIILLHFTYLLMTLAYFYSHDVKPQKSLLTLSEELNQCIEKNEESCCPIYNELVFESALVNIELDHTLCPLF